MVIGSSINIYIYIYIYIYCDGLKRFPRTHALHMVLLQQLAFVLPVCKKQHFIGRNENSALECVWRMSRLTRDRTVEPVLRDRIL